MNGLNVAYFRRKLRREGLAHRRAQLVKEEAQKIVKEDPNTDLIEVVIPEKKPKAKPKKKTTRKKKVK